MKKAFTGNAADEEQVKEAGQREKRGRERDLNDIAFLVSTLPGRRFYWRKLCECGIFTRSAVVGSVDQTFLNEGRREVGLLLLADLMEVAPDAYLLMTEEAKREEENG